MTNREPLGLRNVVTELKRLWIVLLIGALLGASLLPIISRSSARTYTQRVDVRISADATLAGLLGMPGLVPDWRPSVVALDFQSRLDAEVPGRRCGCRLVANDAAGTLSILVDASTSDAALSRGMSIANQILADRSQDFAGRVVATRTSIRSSLEALEKQLQSITDPDSAERIYLVMRQTDESRRLSALEQLASIDRIGVQPPVPVGEASTQPRSSTTTYALLGALLGALLAGVVVVVRRLLSDRVVESEDLRRTGIDVGAITVVDRQRLATNGQAAAIAGSLVRTGTSGVVVVSPSGAAPVDKLALQLVGAIGRFGITARVVELSTDSRYTDNAPLDETPYTIAITNEPFIDSAEAVIACTHLGSVLLVEEQRLGRLATVEEAADLTRSVGATVAGMVLID